jgi:hypothetical protein
MKNKLCVLLHCDWFTWWGIYTGRFGLNRRCVLMLW